jgi:hypothetical protein
MPERFEFRRAQHAVREEPKDMEKVSRNEQHVKLTVCGSPEDSLEKNQEKYGEHIAKKVVEKIKETKKEGKRLVLDIATGASPEPIWPKLKELVDKEGLDLSNVIIMGHEEGWGDIPAGSIVDFDGYRKKVAESLGIEIKPIESADQVSGEGIVGNFMPMHLDVDPRVATAKFRETLTALKKRTDIEFLGLYGVGADGHVDELQIGDMGQHETKPRMETYLDLDPGVLPDAGVLANSVERGLHRWRKPGAKVGDKDEFLKESNHFWYRGKEKNEVFGRAAFQDANFGAVDQVVGLGWRDLLREESMMLLFNNRGKSLAFQLALEGAYDADIVDEEGKKVLGVDYEKGQGEKIFPEFKKYAETLVETGVIDKEQLSSFAKSSEVFRAIYLGLDKIEASSKDPRYIPVYEQLWRFMNDYVGRRAPISRLVKLRSMLGLETELVLVPEVVKGTKYEKLVTRDSSKQ